jgi:hypothetical protein
LKKHSPIKDNTCFLNYKVVLTTAEANWHWKKNKKIHFTRQKKRNGYKNMLEKSLVICNKKKQAVIGAEPEEIAKISKAYTRYT